MLQLYRPIGCIGNPCHSTPFIMPVDSADRVWKCFNTGFRVFSSETTTRQGLPGALAWQPFVSDNEPVVPGIAVHIPRHRGDDTPLRYSTSERQLALSCAQSQPLPGLDQAGFSYDDRKRQTHCRHVFGPSLPCEMLARRDSSFSRYDSTTACHQTLHSWALIPARNRNAFRWETCSYRSRSRPVSFGLMRH